MADELIITKNTGNGRALCRVVKRSNVRIYVERLRGGDGGLSGYRPRQYTDAGSVEVDGPTATPELFDTLMAIDMRYENELREMRKAYQDASEAKRQQEKAEVREAILAARQVPADAELPAHT